MCYYITNVSAVKHYFINGFLNFEEHLRECDLATLETRRQVDVFTMLNVHENSDGNIFLLTQER